MRGGMAVRISMFARYPTPGAAKTRLISALGPDGAATVHRRLVEHLTAALRASGLPFEIRTTGAPVAAFGDWLGRDIAFVDQGEGDLGARLARAGAPGIVIGSDAPGLTASVLRRATKALDDAAAVIGPALDGGYTLLGFREPAPFLFDAMPWGTDAVFAETMRRLDARRWKAVRLEPLQDVDRPEDLALWPEFMP